MVIGYYGALMEKIANFMIIAFIIIIPLSILAYAITFSARWIEKDRNCCVTVV